MKLSFTKIVQPTEAKVEIFTFEISEADDVDVPDIGGADAELM